MIGSVFTYQRLSKDFILCYFIKIWAPIFVRPKAVTDLKNAMYYPLQGDKKIISYIFIVKFRHEINVVLGRSIKI